MQNDAALRLGGPPARGTGGRDQGSTAPNTATSGLAFSPWHGHFKHELPQDPIEYPTNAFLAIQDGKIQGHGQDEDGAYVIEGVYDPSTGRTSWKKVYPRAKGNVIIAFAGKWSAASNSIEGRWRVVNAGAFGTFVLRPGDGIAMAVSMAARANAVTGPLACGLPREIVVFDGERDMLRLLEQDPLFVEARAKAARIASSSSKQHRALLLSGLRLTPRIHPLIFSVVDHCVRRLGISEQVEIYCFPGATLQAFVIRDTPGKVLLGFSSALLDRLDAGELVFVVGHELGHAVFGHVALSGEALGKNERVSPTTVLRLFAYKRYAEITADRVGLLCCDDLGAAVRALFKVTSGLRSAHDIQDSTELAAQFHELHALHASGQGGDRSDWLSTHPYSPLRLEALRLFARSHTFHQLQGRQGGDLSEEQLEHEVGAIVGLMNPSVMFEGSPSRDALLFFALASVEMVIADGHLDAREARLVANTYKRLSEADAAMVAGLTAEERQVVMAETSSKLVHTMSRMARGRMVEDLCAIASADGRIDRSEAGILVGAAQLLGVEPRVVLEALEHAVHALE